MQMIVVERRHIPNDNQAGVGDHAEAAINIGLLMFGTAVGRFRWHATDTGNSQ